VAQFRELVATGAAPRFDLEQAETEVAGLQAESDGAAAAESQVRQRLSARTDDGRLADVAQSDAQLAQAQADLESAGSSEAQVRQKLSARTPDGDLAQVAEAKAMLVAAESQLGTARWNVEQTIFKAPADGTVVDLQLRQGSYTVPMPLAPVMAFVEKEQWVLAIFAQNEVRYVQPGDEAEIAMSTHPGKIIKCKVDSVVWATAQGQLPMSGRIPGGTNVPLPEGRLAVRLMLDGKDKDMFLAAGARGHGAIYTQKGAIVHIIRKVILRVGAKLDWFVLKLH
jgi:multidrug resistance efflux pump